MALAKLVERARREQWKLIDCQFHTGHLERLGAREIGRAEFLAEIRQKPPLISYIPITGECLCLLTMKKRENLNATAYH